MFWMMEYHLKVQWSSIIQKMPERSQYMYCTFWAHYKEVSWHIKHMISHNLARKKAHFRYLRGSAICFRSNAHMAQLTAWVPSGPGTQAGITVGSRSPTGPSWATRREKLLNIRHSSAHLSRRYLLEGLQERFDFKNSAVAASFEWQSIIWKFNMCDRGDRGKRAIAAIATVRSYIYMR